MRRNLVVALWLLFILASAGVAKVAYAQDAVEEAKAKLIQALVILQGIAWIVVALGWVTGNIAIAAPGGGRTVKRAGREMVELSGLSAFLILFGPILIAIIIALIPAIPWPGVETGG